MKSSVAVGLFFVGCLYIVNAMPFDLPTITRNFEKEELFDMKKKIYDTLMDLNTFSTKERMEPWRKPLSKIIWTSFEKFAKHGLKEPNDYESLEDVESDPLVILIIMARKVHHKLLFMVDGDELVQLRKELTEMLASVESQPAPFTDFTILRETLPTLFNKLYRLRDRVYSINVREVEYVLIEFVKRSDEEAHKLKNIKPDETQKLEEEVEVKDMEEHQFGDLIEQCRVRVRNVMRIYWDAEREQALQYIDSLKHYLDEEIKKVE